MKTISILSIAAGVAIVALAPITTQAAFAQAASDPDRYVYGSHMMGWGGGWYGMILGPLFMALVLAAVIVFVVFLVRGINGPWQGSQPTQLPALEPTALDILKKRFARGEIDKEEFEERRRVLED